MDVPKLNGYNTEADGRTSTMGRKPLSDEPKTNRPLRILLTDSERDELDRAAGKLPTSTWARDLLLEAARTKKKRSGKQ
jgi:hypothetical protein